MSTTVAQPMGYQPFTNQCFDPDMDSLVDFNAIQSPQPSSSSSHMPGSTVTSTMSSPTNTMLPLDQSEDHQTPAKPSHEYDLFKQQTGLPSGSVPGLGMPGVNQSVYNGHHQQMFSNSGLGFDEYSMGMGSMDVEMSSNNGLPAFFFSPSESHSDDYVDPSAISHEEPQQAVRFFPGMHQQQAALAAKAQAQAQQQRQQQIIQQQQRERAAQQSSAQPQRKSVSHHVADARTEEIIGRVVNQIRQNSTLQSQPDMQASNVLPHIIKMKKDEEDMDEDERLLASEEGKKLSSKERRQLRNKVSARAFRSRRKEYIGQLEGEVAAKSNEANDLRLQNRALMEENARSRAFIERLLRHQAFGPFLDELSRDPALTEPVKLPTPAPAPRQESFSSAPSMMEDNSQMGMSTIPEQPVDMSMLSISNNGYFPNTGFNFNQPQVFAVFEVPQGPADLFNTDVLSGKATSEYVEEEPVEEIKHDYPVLERPIVEETVEAEAEDVDDGNPDFALYVNTPAPSAARASFDNIASEKAAHFELVTVEESEEQLQQRLDRMCKKMDVVFERMQAATSYLDL
ncbi:uncharacterized protein K452DRAFT_297197 [Aplosporella prunicola CBS 121167]|uniref:BZIP domain-containing protein n=1 Tax=Aplosporella prunicola CBS 121167 TaxID=1176127 RepID=A0A6A6BJK9_9PEZI|nr:uncharacterized protein K452DRAFT_297197 [Aplosporella prunicola CBS 121167]KAF2143464.1 hypothetical protein K452DRAFT_297197 [Aplosporella prunicola CBS 121167]